MLLVIINDLYVRRSRRSVDPFKANPPLIVYADAVLALTVAAQCFKSVPRKSGKITEGCSSLHTIKLEAGRPLKARKRLYTFSGSEVSGPRVTIADYQLTPQRYRIITRYVKRTECTLGGESALLYSDSRRCHAQSVTSITFNCGFSSIEKALDRN